MMGWFTEALIATTLLMGAVLLVREPVAKRFGARAAYLLWLAPALRMLMPPLPADWFGAQLAVLPPTEIAEATTGGLPWLTIILGLWILGSLGFLGWHVLSYSRFSARLRNSAQWLFAEHRIEVAQSREIASPVAFGLLHQTVMLPADFHDRYDETEQRLALSHELTHHHRRDLAANLLALIMLALHWFNPLAHIAYRAFRIDQEAACDADTLRGASPEERHSYGIALFKSATSGLPLAACGSAVAVTIKTRLRRIAGFESQNLGAAPTALLIGVIASALVATASQKVSADRFVAVPPAYAPLAQQQLASQLSQQPNSPPSMAETAAASKTEQKAVKTELAAAATPKSVAEIMPSAEAPSEVARPSVTSPEQSPSAPMRASAKIIEANTANCVATGQQRLSITSDFDGIRSVQMVQFVACNSQASLDSLKHELAQASLTKLRTTRELLAQDQVINAAYRARLLAGLDAEIARLDGPPRTPELTQTISQ